VGSIPMFVLRVVCPIACQAGFKMVCSIAFQAAAHEDDVPSGMPCCSQDDVL